ncbi:hypothetical protein [Desulfonatronospira sp.]|uniref:hypothetical protein n=1 Tax=Desulfonatronospira sp. TaxID=1962951 RepID=UPI0025BFAB40|nr:hypothetical protein [Desulfonatronospira sp.]
MKIIYICGLVHSGSTILDMALGAHSGIVGLGEISRILKADQRNFSNREFTKIHCSCGKDMLECLFWSEIRNKAFLWESQPASLRYEELLTIFSSIFGENKILVDSSKEISPYLLDLHKNHKLKIIFLAKDFRSWSYSIHMKKKKNIFTLPLRWRRENKKLLSFLEKNGLDYYPLGYEEFALYPKTILSLLCRYIGVQFEENMLRPAGSTSHIIRGNRARSDPDKIQAIRYDSRWMTSNKASLLPFLYLPLNSFNKKIVFSNYLKSRKENNRHEGLL